MPARQAPGIALAIGLAAACTSPPSPVPVVVERGDLRRLQGEWSGYYDSPAVGRRGSIVFTLEAGSDTAHGDVVMVPRGWSEPLSPAEDPAAAAADAPTPQTLRIRFVRLKGDTVSGTMDPYRDPECGCLIYTTFSGELADGVIKGSFIARPSHGEPNRGSWLVMRREEE